MEPTPIPIQIALTGQTSKTRPWDELLSDPRVRPWKDIKISESATPLHPQTEAATPLIRRVGVADECDPTGIFPLDTLDLVIGHWRRSFPSVYDTTPKFLQEFGNFMADTPVYDVGMLFAWLEKRPKLNAMMTGIFRDTYRETIWCMVVMTLVLGGMDHSNSRCRIILTCVELDQRPMWLCTS